MPKKKPTAELRELATFPGRLTYARERVQLTQAALAKLAGIDGPRVSRLEDGERAQGIEAATIIRLARALHVPVGWLIADEGLPGPAPVVIEGQDRRLKANRDQGAK